MRSRKTLHKEISLLRFRLEAAHLTLDSMLNGHFPWEAYNNASLSMSGAKGWDVELAITTLLKRNRGE